MNFGVIFMNKKNYVSFVEFINPDVNLKKYKNKNLDINNIFPCSYVIYFIVEHCNGEIMGNNFCISINSYDDLFDYYFGGYCIYAINILDKIVCEVI